MITAAHANATTIVADFSNPVLQGNYTGTDGSQVYEDNTATASYFISNNLNPALAGTPPAQQTGSEIEWGSGTGDPAFSLLIFFGKQVPANPDQTFDLGTLVYLNGTSDFDSLIFGASVTFFAADGTLVNPVCNPATMACGSSAIDIVTTANLSQPGSEAHDADYLSLSGVANQTFNVFEGATATAELYGHFVGDPTIALDSIVLNPGQQANGFIGDGQPSAVPEPATFALFGLGGLALGIVRRVRSN